MSPEKLSRLSLALFLLGACAPKKPESVKKTTQPLVQLSNFTLRPGTYVGQKCFLNKLATEASETPVFTLLEFSIDAQGRGTNHFKQFLNSSCEGEPEFEGTTSIQISYAKSLGGVMLLKIEQPESQDSIGYPQTFWVMAVQRNNDYYLDLDFSDGKAGPYLAEPSEVELTEFEEEFTNVQFQVKNLASSRVNSAIVR